MEQLVSLLVWVEKCCMIIIKKIKMAKITVIKITVIKIIVARIMMVKITMAKIKVAKIKVAKTMKVILITMKARTIMVNKRRMKMTKTVYMSNFSKKLTLKISSSKHIQMDPVAKRWYL